MLETNTTRHNPFIDPHLSIWSWEIPLYLFFGGIVAGMMVLAGIAMLRVARGDDSKSFFSMQTPLLAFVLMNIGMLALLLDLTHRLYVWRIYTTFQYRSPMAWGSWVLLVVYGVLMLSALIRLPEAWPWIGRRVTPLRRWSDAILARPLWLRALAWANLVLGVGLGIYTGILLNTMVARPLWNSAILGPLFLFSGLSAGAAMVHWGATMILSGRAD
jgi:formate-dependent nitrite reductase membrane component NrfD